MSKHRPKNKHFYKLSVNYMLRKGYQFKAIYFTRRLLYTGFFNRCKKQKKNHYKSGLIANNFL